MRWKCNDTGWTTGHEMSDSRVGKVFVKISKKIFESLLKRSSIDSRVWQGRASTKEIYTIEDANWKCNGNAMTQARQSNMKWVIHVLEKSGFWKYSDEILHRFLYCELRFAGQGIYEENLLLWRCKLEMQLHRVDNQTWNEWFACWRSLVFEIILIRSPKIFVLRTSCLEGSLVAGFVHTIRALYRGNSLHNHGHQSERLLRFSMMVGFSITLSMSRTTCGGTPNRRLW